MALLSLTAVAMARKTELRTARRSSHRFRILCWVGLLCYMRHSHWRLYIFAAFALAGNTDRHATGHGGDSNATELIVKTWYKHTGDTITSQEKETSQSGLVLLLVP